MKNPRRHGKNSRDTAEVQTTKPACCEATVQTTSLPIFTHTVKSYFPWGIRRTELSHARANDCEMNKWEFYIFSLYFTGKDLKSGGTVIK